MVDRFSLDQLRRLGHTDYCEMLNNYFSFAHPEYILDDVCDCPEEFKSILDTFVSSFVDGSLPNFVNPSIPESAPRSVKEFFASFTTQSLTSLLSAPDDEVAFDSIIPRGCSYSKYRDIVKNVIHKYSSDFNAKHSKPD